MEKDKSEWKRILLFLGITFVITYVVEIFMIAPMADSTDVNMALAAQSMIASVMFVPTFAVILTRLFTQEGFMGSNLYIAIKLKKNIKYYALVWPGFALLILLGTGIYFMIFRNQFDPNLSYAVSFFSAQTGTEMPVDQVRQTLMIQLAVGILLSPLMNFVNCFGEEWGWRGYLLPKLLKVMPVVPAVLLDGVIWGLWHAPLVALLGFNYGRGYAGYPVRGILMMCVFCVVMGTILSYVTIKSRTVIPAIFGHGMLNGIASFGIYLTSLQEPYNVFLGPAPIGWIGMSGFILVAGFLLYRLWIEEKSKLAEEKSA